MIDGIIIVATTGEVIQFNHRAAQLCPTLNQGHSIKHSCNHNDNFEPFAFSAEIWRVCEALVESNDLFAHQKLIPESEVLMNSTIIRIRSQWLTIHATNAASRFDKSKYSAYPSILVTLEDRTQALQNLARTDIQKHNLTPREGEIWQLRLLGKSYREIAAQLYITEHTVKKHIGNILAKRRIE
ncbi:LuxR family transcriptional regulator [Cyanobacteria bacterium FACHB-63]|nr:LuxR family transcriptional regulator [Cyanobacteria bacterium FACHB-63]